MSARAAPASSHSGPARARRRRRLRTLAANARNSLDALGSHMVCGGQHVAARFGTINNYIESATTLQMPVYVTDVAMLVIQYAQICLPCLFAVATVPVNCFCLPCVIGY